MERQSMSPGGDPGSNPIDQNEVDIAAGALSLHGLLAVPPAPRGVVLFAHGSGSGRYSPRNQFVAGELNDAGFATLLLDLLTDAESNDRSYVFDTTLLADRLVAATEWVRLQNATRTLPVGYFGASTGAGAALIAASRIPKIVGSVVSRGGRPDLAGAALGRVECPTLLIVGGNDQPVIALNKFAYDQIRAIKRLVIVSGATHLFEEPGTLEEVARLAIEWFAVHLKRRATA